MNLPAHLSAQHLRAEDEGYCAVSAFRPPLAFMPFSTKAQAMTIAVIKIRNSEAGGMCVKFAP